MLKEIVLLKKGFYDICTAKTTELFKNVCSLFLRYKGFIILNNYGLKKYIVKKQINYNHGCSGT